MRRWILVLVFIAPSCGGGKFSTGSSGGNPAPPASSEWITIDQPTSGGDFTSNAWEVRLQDRKSVV